MRLIGYAFAGAAPPLNNGYVGFSAHTSIAGANDVGKTALLDRIFRELEGLELRTNARTPSDAAGVFYAELTDAEADAVVWLATADVRWLDAGRPGEKVFPRRGPYRQVRSHEQAMGVFPEPGNRGLFWPFKGWDLAALDGRGAIDPESPLESWMDRLEKAGESETLDAARQLLNGSRVYAFRDAGMRDQDGPLRGWDIGWCARVEQGAVPPMELRDEPPVSPDPWLQSQAPAPIAPVGTAWATLLPRPVRVPTDQAALDRGILDRMEEVQAVRRFAPHLNDDAQFTYDHWIVTREDGSEEIHKTAIETVAAVERRLTASLPDFVSSTYEFDLQVSFDYVHGKEAELRVRNRHTNAKVSPSELAEGLRTWVQLAQLELVDQLDRWLAVQQVISNYLGPALHQELEEGPEPGGDADSYIRHFSWLTSEADAMPGLPEDFFDRYVLGRGEVGAGVIAWDYVLAINSARERLYILDEPERNLNPRLARSAARWLATIRERGHSSSLFCTHSVAFLSSPGMTMNYLSRPIDGPTTVRPVDPTTLSALDEISSDIGLDRGELLTAFAAFLFVEGAHDESFLEALVGPELRELGVCVVPLRGADRGRTIVDSPLLLRFTSGPIAVWLDNVRASVAHQMQVDPRFAERVGGGKEPRMSTEERAMGRLASEASIVERPIRLIPSPAADVFDLLDDDYIREQYPKWPGHSPAREAVGRVGTYWKDAYFELYDVPVTVETSHGIARAMRRDGQVPATVSALLATVQDMLDPVALTVMRPQN